VRIVGYEIAMNGGFAKTWRKAIFGVT